MIMLKYAALHTAPLVCLPPFLQQQKILFHFITENIWHYDGVYVFSPLLRRPHTNIYFAASFTTLIFFFFAPQPHEHLLSPRARIRRCSVC